MYASHEQMCNPYLEWAVPQWLNEAIVLCPFHRLTALSLPLLVAGCFGGQSGDDGDFRGPQPPGPVDGPVGGVDGLPLPEAPDGCEDDTTELEFDELTAFGKPALELVTGIAPPDAPFFWVDYDSGNLEANHSLPTRNSTLHLEFEVREESSDAEPAVTQIARKPVEGNNRTCDVTVVRVPVWVTMTTADSGLRVNEVAGYLDFYGPEVAQLHARFSPLQMNGSLNLSLVAKNEPDVWELSGFTLIADVWRGGSSGILSPEFTRAGPAPGTASGGMASPPPPAEPVSGHAYEIVVPERWEAVGVWPRLEQCLPGVVRHVNDPVLGLSVADVQTVLNAAAPFALEVSADQTNSGTQDATARLTTDSMDLVCVEVSGARELKFTVPGSLVISTPDATLTEAELQLSVVASVSPSSPSQLDAIHFERRFEDVPLALSRSEFEQQLGPSLTTVPDEYQKFWWTWFGSLTPMEPSPSAVFLVTSPNAQQTELIQRQVAEGGPGFAFAQDESGQVLPGDPIFRATTRK
jgi:hypothetical protein